MSLRPGKKAATAAFIASLQYYPISLAAASLAGGRQAREWPKDITLNLGDVTIAAVAIHNEVTLLTENGQGFPYERTFLLFVPQAIGATLAFCDWSHPHGEEVECTKN